MYRRCRLWIIMDSGSLILSYHIYPARPYIFIVPLGIPITHFMTRLAWEPQLKIRFDNEIDPWQIQIKTQSVFYPRANHHMSPHYSETSISCKIDFTNQISSAIRPSSLGVFADNIFFLCEKEEEDRELLLSPKCNRGKSRLGTEQQPPYLAWLFALLCQEKEREKERILGFLSWLDLFWSVSAALFSSRHEGIKRGERKLSYAKDT